MEASYLVIGGEPMRKEDDYANYKSEESKVKSKIFSTVNDVSPSTNYQMRAKPETSSHSTTFTAAPSVSSSSSSAPSSMSPTNADRNLKSPSSLHDSTISRLIDAVSLGNEEDTCRSISALIGQLETTTDHKESTNPSHDHTPVPCSNFYLTTPEAQQVSSSPHKPKPASINHLMSPQKFTQKTNHLKHEIPPQVNGPKPASLPSPETTELEEIYTILDEEMLLPISVYNVKEQTVHVQADGMKSTPSKQAVQSSGRGHAVSWGNMHQHRDRGKDTENVEESIYEEVHDPPDIERRVSQRYIGTLVNNDYFHFHHDPSTHTFAEVEINVDDDPLEMMQTSLRRGSRWIADPTKQDAIYQNQSTPNYSHRSHCDLQRQNQSHASHLAFSQCPSPITLHQHQNNSQPSPFHRATNPRFFNASRFQQNGYNIPESDSEAYNNSRDLRRLYTQHRIHSDNQNLNKSYQERRGFKQTERGFHNGPSTSESLPTQSAVPINSYRDKSLYSPPSDADAVYSHLDDICLTPHPESSLNNQVPRLNKTTTPKQPWNKNVSPSSTRHQSRTESPLSRHPNMCQPSTKHLPGTSDASAPSPSKSKSLGDLTSEDISCNFQSKYHIISRSFITPHMRKQKRTGITGSSGFQSHSRDPLTEQLRKLVSLEGDDIDRDPPLLLRQESKSTLPQPQEASQAPVVPGDEGDSPPLLTRRLSSRSQSRVRHINSRARERQQEALKPGADVALNGASSIGGVVLRNKPSSQNPPANRHSTGSYIAGYFGQLEDRGLPEGACKSLGYGNWDQHGDRFYTDDSLPPADSNHSASEPEVYFLLRL